MTRAFRFTDPAPPSAATGVTADVYGQMARDFGIERAATFVVLSDSPPLMTGAWALLRESLLAGRVSRTDKEVVAAGVSLANRCPFCVDAHTVLLHATGDHALAETIARGEEPADAGHRRLLAWGKDIRGPRPFPAEQTPEHLGTALAFHFINRIVSALLNENMLPGGPQKYRLVRSAAGRSLARTVRREVPPGESLELLRTSGTEPAWAAGTAVGTAYGALREAALMGAGLLSEDDRTLVRKTVADHDGVARPPLSADWLPDREESPGARLTLLAALAPYRITEEDVRAWRTPRHTDHCLVHLTAYGAITAVERIEEQL
ncbi:carboxymuconolactone decarboxylase family protein [Streptomyces pristinaespiralis]|uniref:carboxymuconolactone decarboxylase family protein n=1 Tax=Streptomyces pristinaespiralis TaxID=38300 RepID=UPI003834B9B2